MHPTAHAAQEAARYARTAVRILRDDGGRALAQRAARYAYERLHATTLDFPLFPGDVADCRELRLPVPAVAPPRSRPLTIGWVCTPPGAGSGGHTTMFRMVEALEHAGHTCVMFLYDRSRGELGYQAGVIRSEWPSVRAEVRSIDDGLGHLDAYVATSWQTAHVIASRVTVPARRLYLVQDYEPYFYPRGAEYALAEDTYRFGFRCITIGPSIAAMLAEHFRIECAVIPHGCDTKIYRLTNHGGRPSVSFYAKADAARRGYMLGVLALELFNRAHPEVSIELFGDARARVPFPATNHGLLSPTDLAELYNRCGGGLALSFTNLSLVPDEMLACGATPIVNDAPLNRASLSNPAVRWAAPTPPAMARALASAIRPEGMRERASAAASSVVDNGWATGQRAMVAAVEAEVYGVWPP